MRSEARSPEHGCGALNGILAGADVIDATRGMIRARLHTACGGPLARFGSEARLARAEVDTGRSTSRTRAGAKVAASGDTGAAGGADVVQRLQCSHACPGFGTPVSCGPAEPAGTLWQMTESGSAEAAAAATGIRPARTTCRATA